MANIVFERITIIGLGLIGSSIARAARANKLAETIVGCDQNEVSLAYARQQGFIDVGALDPAIGVQGSGLVILATPPSTLESLTEKIAPHLAHGAMVMDMCSVKRMAMEAIAAHLPTHVDFVPAHPIAGSEQTGVSAGRADLFSGKRIIVTPNEPLQGDTLQKVNNFWQSMGARVEGMPPHLHDMVYGYVSHLPQLLAFCLAAPLGASIATGEGDEIFTRFTRLAGSSPALWSDIFYYNKDNIIKSLDEYLNVISHVHDELLDAPDNAPKEADEQLARTVLFPRIAASCLVTTIMNAERKAGFPFARYAGTGFADFASPVTLAPDETIEKISDHASAVRPILRQFIDELAKKRVALT